MHYAEMVKRLVGLGWTGRKQSLRRTISKDSQFEPLGGGVYRLKSRGTNENHKNQ